MPNNPKLQPTTGADWASLKEFCQQHKVHRSTVWRWKRQGRVIATYEPTTGILLVRLAYE